MYLRRSIVRRGSKTHTYWRLVRSVRRGKRVRQETVAMLGELDAEGRAKASALARHFLGPKANQRQLFEDAPKPSLSTVRTDKVRFERQRKFGDMQPSNGAGPKPTCKLIGTDGKKLPVVRIGSLLRFRREDLVEFAAQHAAWSMSEHLSQRL